MPPTFRTLVALLLVVFVVPGCDGGGGTDGGLEREDAAAADGDVANTDAGSIDSGASDAGSTDGGSQDAGTTGDAGPTTEIDALFVGNSYTDANNLPNMVQMALESAGVPLGPLTLERSTAGGRRLTQHAGDSVTVGHPLQASLSEGTLTHVILQEQSQIPGFGDGNGEFELSKTAAFDLAGLADARSARVVMYVTWGRREGDDGNPGLYPDFNTMQTRLDAGYATLAAQAEMAGADVVLAPVGPAFREIWQEDDAAGDPLDPGSLFYRLYVSDGSHPSVHGTYLAACVFVATLLGVPATDIAFVPAGIEAADALRLREAAGRAVAGEL